MKLGVKDNRGNGLGFEVMGDRWDHGKMPGMRSINDQEQPDISISSPWSSARSIFPF